MKSREVYPGPGNQGDQPGDNVQRLKNDMGRTVAPAEINEEWKVRRYLDMTAFHEWQAEWENQAGIPMEMVN